MANAYLEGTYTEVYPDITRDEEGLRRLFRQFSFPGGIPSHVAPETPGSIHEGGELGYALAHAYGAAFDNPDLIVACVIGDGEAETGPLAASWHSNKFLDPVRDGAVLPILHLNGYKIANPTVLARIPADELRSLLEGYGHAVIEVSGDEPISVHQQMAAALDGRPRRDRRDPATGPCGRRRTPRSAAALADDRAAHAEGLDRAQDGGRAAGGRHLALPPGAHRRRPRQPGAPGPARVVDAQLPSRGAVRRAGALVPELADLPPRGERRMSANPRTPTAASCCTTCACPTSATTRSTVTAPGTTSSEATRVLGDYLRDIIRLNPETFRLFGPDETASNRLGAVFEATDKAWMAETLPVDEHLAPDGRVMEVLSEHLCQGWLEGYLLTGRHGLFNCYEAFIHIVDSMFNQHAKWLKVTRGIPWRRPIASLNYLLSSHVWRQDHNGFSHQDPGFIDHVVNKKAEVIRVYLPPDANTLLSVGRPLPAQPQLRQRHRGRQAAVAELAGHGRGDSPLHARHRHLGVGQQRRRREPDVVLACCGDVPTLETLAAVDLLREHLPS